MTLRQNYATLRTQHTETTSARSSVPPPRPAARVAGEHRTFGTEPLDRDLADRAAPHTSAPQHDDQEDEHERADRDHQNFTNG
jgi:hypothetical protein